MREYRQATVSKIHRYSNTVYIYHFIFQFKCKKLGYLNSGELRQIQQGDNTFLSSYLCVSKCSAYFHLTYLPGLIDNWVNYGNISVSDICIVFNMWCIQQEHYFHAETEHWWINRLPISITLDFTPSSLAFTKCVFFNTLIHAKQKDLMQSVIPGYSIWPLELTASECFNGFIPQECLSNSIGCNRDPEITLV